MTIIKNIKTFARVHPDRAALMDEDICLTYKELDLLSTNWALNFLQMGIQKNDRVMVCMRNSSRFLAVIVALEKLDATIMPINYQLFHKDVKDICDNYHVKCIVTESYFEDSFPSMEDTILYVENFNLDFTDRCESESTPLVEDYQDDSEMIFFTSGSTGKPKGIVLLKKSLNPTILPDYLNDRASIHLLVRPMFFRSHLSLAYSTILLGDTLVVSRSDNPCIIYQLLTTKRVNQMTSGPSDLHELVKYMELTPKNAPPSLKEVMTTGRALPDELKQKLILYFPSCDIIDFYGTSEVGAISSISKLEWKTKNKSSGKPEFFVDVIIIDDNRETLEALEVGEICVKSKYAMLEYKFEESLMDDTLIGEYICTGDMGYIDEDGYLFILGRKKEVINRGGFYFYPSELEKNILEIKGVQQATVLPVSDIKWGQVPAAFIVLEESHQRLDVHVIREHIKTRLLVSLPSNKIPEYFVFLEELPINLGGKIDNSRLLNVLTNVINH